MERRRERPEEPQRPIARPRVKVMFVDVDIFWCQALLCCIKFIPSFFSDKDRGGKGGQTCYFKSSPCSGEQMRFLDIRLSIFNYCLSVIFTSLLPGFLTQPKPPPIKLHRPQDIQSERATPVPSPEPSGATPLQSPARKRATPLRSSDLPQATPLLILDTSQTTPSRSPTKNEQRLATPSRSPTRKQATSRPGSARSARSSVSEDRTLQVSPVGM